MASESPIKSTAKRSAHLQDWLLSAVQLALFMALKLVTFVAVATFGRQVQSI